MVVGAAAGGCRHVLDGHVLILVAGRLSRRLCLTTQALHPLHDIVWLCQEGITQALNPHRVLSQRRQDLGKATSACTLSHGWFATCLTASSPLASGLADQVTASATSQGR